MTTTENDKYPVSDWQYEVSNGDTRLGYEEWLSHKLDSEEENDLRTPPAGSWASTARLMAGLGDDDFDWDAWKDSMKDGDF